jgi:hypothetical protein
MVLHFNVTGSKRKEMARAIEKVTGQKARYLGAPTFSYKTGIYEITIGGALIFENDDMDITSDVINACVDVTGVTPKEWDDVECEISSINLSIPQEEVNIDNLNNILTSKGSLIKKALGIESIRITISDGNVVFPWISGATPEESDTYVKFVSALCRMSRESKRTLKREKDVSNEKYAFRCFLLRLGFIGNEYKKDRKILLSKLEGSSAFKSRKEGINEFSKERNCRQN